jgi:uncharacterized YceG family protein
MTDLGRGTGSDPWHPGDPLYGDPDWSGQGPSAGEWDGYAAAPRAQAQAAHWGGGYGGGPADPYGHGDPLGDDPLGQGYPPAQAHGQGHGSQGEPYQDPYGQQSGDHGYDPYAQPGTYGRQDPYYGEQQHDPYGQPYGQPDPYGQQPFQGQQDGGHGYQDQYGQQEFGPQGGAQEPDPRFQDPFAGAEPYDPYGHVEPEGPHDGSAQDGSGHGESAYGESGYDESGYDGSGYDEPGYDGSGYGEQSGRDGQRSARPHDDDHPFFADDADGDDGTGERAADGPGRGERRRGKQQQRKPRRSGVACLFVLVVLGGGLYGVGHFGYQFYQQHFGPAPDYSGDGEGSIQVEVPQGASSSDIARILVHDDVVKSTSAFIDAANGNPEKARAIQPGIYSLKKHMSATAAFDALTDTGNLNNLTIPEGWRASRIYAAIDQRLHLKAGTTAKEAAHADLGLPSWAHGNVEGFLFPSRYSVGKSTKPVDVLRAMVKQATQEYRDDGLLDAAKTVNKSPYDVLVLASIVQAEAQESKDFSKVARVLYNRLDTQATNGLLQMDSTVNYARGRSTLNVSVNDTHFQSPYNTYLHKGLPPGPIDNPGNEAIAAALHPAKGDWLYFVTVKPGDTRFTASAAQHAKNVADFNKYQREHGGG